MNLLKLFELQRQLDEHIERECSSKEDGGRIAKKILALQVELGKLANEWRGFKFWSRDQEPRIEQREYKVCPSCGGEYVDSCWECGHSGQVLDKIINPLLEKCVNCLYFILSIGLEITEPDMINLKRWNLTKADNITEQFLWVMADVTDLYNGLYHDGNFKFDYEFLLLRFIHLGEMLGFIWDEIEQAYFDRKERMV